MLVSKRRQQKLTKSSLPNAKDCLPSNGQHKLEQVANASARHALHRQLSASHVGAHVVNTSFLMQLCLIWTLVLRTLKAWHILSSLRCILGTHTHIHTFQDVSVCYSDVRACGRMCDGSARWSASGHTDAVVQLALCQEIPLC